MNKLLSIQTLRGIAALLVVFLHISFELSSKTNGSIILGFYNLNSFGLLGVDIFFVISGFIIFWIHGNDFQKKNAFQIFFIKRLTRIVPLYWLFTIISALILLLIPELFTKGKEFEFTHFLTSLLFFPWYNSVGEIYPILAVGWTLNIEMYFYFVFALTLFLVNSHHKCTTKFN